jgi:hypothetical protein
MVQYLLLAGQIFVVLLVYLFVWRTMRGARHDLLDAARPDYGGGRGAQPGGIDAQESTIMPAADVAAARRAAGLREPRLVVDDSPVLREGVPFTIGSALTIGRADGNDVVLDDNVVSGQHARVISPGTVIDNESTNGTYVNGKAIRGRATLRHGDILQVGSTVFRYEGPGR